MSDSGSSQFPTRPPVAPQIILPAKGEVKAQIIDASGKLAKVDVPRTVSGEVTAVNRDGTVEVTTDEGTLTLKPRDRVVAAEGQRVEVDVAAGSPPKQAVVRPAPATSAPNVLQATPSSSQSTPSAPVLPLPASATEQPIQADKPVARPLDPSMQADLSTEQSLQPLAKPQAGPIAPQSLPENAIVRLKQLPPAYAKQLVDMIVQTVQAKVMNIATLSTQTVQTAMMQELTQAIPALPRTAIEAIVQQAMAPQPNAATVMKAPMTAINDIVNNTALTPSIQPLRSPVETFMRQILTQGTSFAPQPSPVLSTQIMMPQANTQPLPLATMTLPDTVKPLLTLTPPVAPTLPPDTPDAFNVPLVIKSGGSLDARVLNFTQPATPSSFTPPTASAPVAMPSVSAPMTAQVITVTPQQMPVLSMMMPGADAPQLFTMIFPATNLTPGTSLNVLPQTPVTVTAPTTAPTPLQLLTGFTWPVFDEFMDLENIAFPNPTTQTLANILPNPAEPNKIPAAALMFIAAVKAGDINLWLGDKNIEAMRRTGKAEFVSRMMREFSGLNKLSSEPVTPEWRGMSIPMYGQGQIDKIHLYYRHSDHGDDRDQEQAEKGKGTRFIMDMNLSQIGDVQLDGYSRGKQLDLAVRTKQPFSAAMRYEMTQRYIRTLEKVGMEGALVFQAQPDKFIKITPRMDVVSASA